MQLAARDAFLKRLARACLSLLVFWAGARYQFECHTPIQSNSCGDKIPTLANVLVHQLRLALRKRISIGLKPMIQAARVLGQKDADFVGTNRFDFHYLDAIRFSARSASMTGALGHRPE